MLTEGDVIRLRIEKLVYGGQGLGYAEEQAVFVARAAPGDELQVRIIKAKRGYAVGEILEILCPSPLRVSPPSPYYERCGGCQLQHLGYAEQLQAKFQQVRETLVRLGGLPDPPVRDILPADQPFGYRNKAIYHARVSPEGRLLLGLMGGKGDEVVEVASCLLQPESSNRALARVRAALERAIQGAAIDPALFRHVMIRTSEATGQTLGVVVVRQRTFAGKDRLLEELAQERADIDSCWLNVNSRADHSTLGPEYERLWGPTHLRERLCGMAFDISPEAFFQVNIRQTEKLLAVVKDYAALTGREIVLDLYCGTGAIAICLAPQCHLAYGIEVSRSATLDAIRNAQINGLDNCRFRTGKVEKLMRKLLARDFRTDAPGSSAPRVAILDPPRGGCLPEVLEGLAKMRVERVVYVSCSPPTLARDLKRLKRLGYDLVEVQPLDMFPQTYHIECVALLSQT
ncbi:MAG: 23S rRNA (uracil(1939)-C(5))-methyltransferase RlmD [Candidatus Tectomicrobia bacterium]|uniref:23S rRNA (Uracil(1939)-C(5))-methyltransferase RlmD n=1 Tax=Tectimicrobiota bacterium TaxID=2528274 RepID=A0A932G1L1_UNCTE|nr:23S rRNA (uracil(1939)-C(5))-methyltransferase RlmD [Candidatus Tectomicrobia bacterium]